MGLFEHLRREYEELRRQAPSAGPQMQISTTICHGTPGMKNALKILLLILVLLRFFGNAALGGALGA